MNGGASCCKHYRRKLDLASGCDGGDLDFDDPDVCCYNDEVEECPNAFGGCKNHVLSDSKYFELKMIETKTRGVFLGFCPRNPGFTRVLGSRVGYVMDDPTLSRTRESGVIHCRDDHNGAILPSIRNEQEMREVSEAMYELSGTS